MIDVTTLTDAELADVLAQASRETQKRQTRADIPRRLEAAIAAAQDAGIEDVEQVITAARSRAANRGRGVTPAATQEPAAPPQPTEPEQRSTATATRPAQRIEPGEPTI